MVTIKNLLFKYKLYGLKYFIYFSLVEGFRKILRTLNISYSEWQEDLYVSRLLHKDKITYIDIGSNDPIKFNNTYKFYKSGGHGVSVEPNPLLSTRTSQIRPRDINLNIGLGKEKGKTTFYVLDPDVNSTFDPQESARLVKNGCHLINSLEIQIDTLQNIFKNSLKLNYVDLISIDTEHFDYEVLCGNDWQKYRSKIIIIESDSTQTKNLLNSNGYKLVKNIGLNHIYVDTR